MFDTRWILTKEQTGKIFHGTDDASRVPFQSCLPPAKKSRLVGYDFHENPISHTSVADEGFDSSDFHIFLSSDLNRGKSGWAVRASIFFSEKSPNLPQVWYQGIDIIGTVSFPPTRVGGEPDDTEAAIPVQCLAKSRTHP